MAKARAKSAITTNLSILTNGISAQPAVFSEVVNACGEKKLITSKQAKEYVDNSAGKEISTRAGNLVFNIMTVTDIIPGSLDTFLCILYDSDDIVLKKVASKIANDYGRDLPQYSARLDSDINEDIPANTHVPSSNSPLPPSPPPPRKPSNHSSSFSIMRPLVLLAIVVVVIGATSPFLYSYLDQGSKGPENAFIKPPVVEEKLDNANAPFQHTDTPPNNDPLPPSSSAGKGPKEDTPVVEKKLDNPDVPSQHTDTQPKANNDPLPPSSSAGKGPKETEKNLDNADVPFKHTDTQPNNDPLPPSSLDEKPLKLRDLYSVIKSLNENDYDVSTWSDLCLALGLSPSRINTIRKDEMDSNDRFRSCLTKWLNRVDQVDEFGGATLASLATALEDIGQKAVSEKLKETK